MSTNHTSNFLQFASTYDGATNGGSGAAALCWSKPALLGRVAGLATKQTWLRYCEYVFMRINPQYLLEVDWLL